jgi:hypothetical protein
MTTDPEDDNGLAIYRRLLDNMPSELREKFLNAAFLAGLSQEDCIGLLAQPAPIKPGSNLLLDTIETLESARQSMEKANRSHEAIQSQTIQSLEGVRQTLEKSTERANWIGEGVRKMKRTYTIFSIALGLLWGSTLMVAYRVGDEAGLKTALRDHARLDALEQRMMAGVVPRVEPDSGQ